MTEFDFKNGLHTASVVWELSLPGLNFWLGNTLAYIILHLQKSTASAVQTATCREENEPERGEPGRPDGRWCGPCKEEGGPGSPSLQEGSLPARLAPCCSTV